VLELGEDEDGSGDVADRAGAEPDALPATAPTCWMACRVSAPTSWRHASRTLYDLVSGHATAQAACRQSTIKGDAGVAFEFLSALARVVRP